MGAFDHDRDVGDLPILLRSRGNSRALGGDNNNNQYQNQQNNNNNNQNRNQNQNNNNNNKNQNQQNNNKNQQNNNNNNNNNNNKNQQNNNNKNNQQWQQNQNNYNDYFYNSYGYVDTRFNPSLFFGTVVACTVIGLVSIFRIKLRRKAERKRKRLGKPPSQNNARKRCTKGGDDEDSIITDEEIRKYILPATQKESKSEAKRVAGCDKETDRIMQLCKPFALEAVVSAVCDVFNTALLGKALGIEALAIYYIVTVPTAFTETIISAVLDTVSSLGGQSIGVGSYKLTGQYCQISIILYTIMFIPHAILWICYLKPTIRWFAPNLDEFIIEEGYRYFLVSLLGTYIDAYSSVIHSLLEVTDQAEYSMKSGIVQEIVGVLSFFTYVSVNPWKQKSIVTVEIIDAVFALVFLLIDLFVAKRMKWIDDFWKGMLHSVAMKNWEAVWLVLKTAAPMSIGNIIMTVEWEMLAIFAAHLGGLQVAAWGIIGTIWGILEYATSCFACAGEIRVAKLLGNGNSRLAKLSAYKCLFLGNLFALMMTVFFLLGLGSIPRWFTNDLQLQAMIINVLPYCAIGNLSLTIGTLAYTLVGAQGRYNVSTYHGCIGSLFFALPCAALAIFRMDGGLDALAASVVVGYMISGSLNTVTLFLSDWDYIAYRVMIRNGATEPVTEEEEEEEEEESIGWFSFFSPLRKKVDVVRKVEDKEQVLIDTLDSDDNESWDDGDDDFPKKLDDNTQQESTAAGSWWSALGFDHNEDEIREVLVGPGSLNCTIQSTKEGPMIVGLPKANLLTGGHRVNRAKILKGELFLGDIIVRVDNTRTSTMRGGEVAKLLLLKRTRKVRTLIVSHKEGTGLTTVYQPGPFGSAAVTGALNGAKDVDKEGFEDDGVVGAGYLNMGWFS